MYKYVYAAEFGQFDGESVAAMTSAYEFSISSQDVELMRYMSAVDAMAHAPVIAFRLRRKCSASKNMRRLSISTT
ncbi:type VI secretion system contractile sheath domain-containing protein [Bradyrhizobium cenepequi]|uniref:type VI secretion system contractile sheath domain-containing protein n=1 Tax=Bradyrhizobium cenepequi TaxID=2821403 RepID=UPI001CE39E08